MAKPYPPEWNHTLVMRSFDLVSELMVTAEEQWGSLGYHSAKQVMAAVTSYMEETGPDRWTEKPDKAKAIDRLAAVLRQAARHVPMTDKGRNLIGLPENPTVLTNLATAVHDAEAAAAEPKTDTLDKD